jgi:hypothetical protein
LYDKLRKQFAARAIKKGEAITLPPVLAPTKPRGIWIVFSDKIPEAFKDNKVNDADAVSFFAHELQHAFQFTAERESGAKFVPHYLSEYLSNKKLGMNDEESWARISFEVEAIAAEKTALKLFKDKKILKLFNAVVSRYKNDSYKDPPPKEKGGYNAWNLIDTDPDAKELAKVIKKEFKQIFTKLMDDAIKAGVKYKPLGWKRPGGVTLTEKFAHEINGSARTFIYLPPR